MNTTPRLLNRFVLAVIGLGVLGAGTAGLLLLALPGAATWWGSAAPRIGGDLDTVREDTTLEGQADTWLWLVLAAALVLVIVLLVVWIMAQGRGRTGHLLAGGPSSTDGADSTEGTVTISAAAAEQLLRAALLERPDVVGAAVSTWCMRGVPGLRVRVQPRKGTPPYTVAREVSELVRALDAVTGLRPPVLISISTGSRVRFSRAERVT